MNPLTNVRNVQKLNERELELGMIGKKSWHDEYKDSAWVFIGGLPYDLSEGDIICVFSQYGEIVNFNLVRDHKTGKSKGFGFMCFMDQRSTILSVDNLNGIKILGRTIRVDHVKEYKIPKEHKNDDDLVVNMREEGCAPKIQGSSESEKEKEDSLELAKVKKHKKEKKRSKKGKKKKKKRKSSSSSSSESEPDDKDTVKSDLDSVEVKQEKHDPGYDKAGSSPSHSNFRDREYKNRKDHSQARNGESQGKKDIASDNSRGSSRSGPASLSRGKDASLRVDGRSGKSDISERDNGEKRYFDKREERHNEDRGHRERREGRMMEERDDEDRRQRWRRDERMSEERDSDRHRGRDKERDNHRERSEHDSLNRDRKRDSYRDSERKRDRSPDRNKHR